MVMLSGNLIDGHAFNLNYDLRRLFVVVLPARAQSFSRQDLDCAVAATIEDERADKGTTGENSFHELMIFFIFRLNAQDDQTNWARVVYDRSKLNRKRGSAWLSGKMHGALSKLAPSIVVSFPMSDYFPRRSACGEETRAS